jgi:hypothetical protein
MQKCLNCDSQITCGCQRRHASDGKLVCTKCIEQYEKGLAELKQAKQQNNNTDQSKNKT